MAVINIANELLEANPDLLEVVKQGLSLKVCLDLMPEYPNTSRYLVEGPNLPKGEIEIDILFFRDESKEAGYTVAYTGFFKNL